MLRGAQQHGVPEHLRSRYLPVSQEHRTRHEHRAEGVCTSLQRACALASKSEEVSGEAALNAHGKALKLQPAIQAAHANFENSPTASQAPSLPEAKLHM